MSRGAHTFSIVARCPRPAARGGVSTAVAGSRLDVPVRAAESRRGIDPVAGSIPISRSRRSPRGGWPGATEALSTALAGDSRPSAPDRPRGRGPARPLDRGRVHGLVRPSRPGVAIQGNMLAGEVPSRHGPGFRGDQAEEP